MVYMAADLLAECDAPELLSVGSNAELLAYQEQTESSARSYPRRIPLAIRRARGVVVEDMDGRRYYDCLAGAGTLALGHNHPVVVEAIRRVLAEELPMQTLDLTTPAKDAFVRELLTCLPAEFAADARIQFCGPSGADGVEAAIKLAKTATGRRSVLAFHGAYHGMTHGALSLTGELGPKMAVANLMPEVHFLPFPYPYRCPFGLGGEGTAAASISYVERLLDDSNSGITPPAAVIVEPIQGEGGVIPAPDEWLRQLRAITTERNIPLILDEVQTGGGRTGRMFAFEHAGIVPDAVVLSKAIGGGLPLCVVVYRSHLDTWKPGAHAGTFRGNQLAMAAGTAALRHTRERKLPEHAAQMGARLAARLRELQQQQPCIGDVRGRGLMLGVEVVDTDRPSDRLGVHPPHTELARRIQAECLERGLIVELGGRRGAVVRFLPPLILNENDVDRIAEMFAQAVAAAERLGA